MRFLWSIHLYPPHHNCGSEMVAHHINRYLISKGHEVRVVLHQARQHNVNTPYTWEGVEVFAPTSLSAPNCLDSYRWADVILTHLDFTQYSISMGNLVRKPVVNFIHNSHPYDSIIDAQGNNYVVYNSEWVKEVLQYKWPSIVLPPPCDFRYYDVCENPEGNEFITLISLNKNKGGEIFYEVAKKLPHKKFLGVKGSYDEQLTKSLPNVTLIENTPDILSVYRKTRILLMPSRYESWGRTATEAMSSGIPVICCPTPGLKENCGDAGIYVPPRKQVEYDKRGMEIDDGTPENYDVSAIISEILRLDEKTEYQKASDKARARSRELDPQSGYKQLEDFLYSTRCNVTV